MHLRHLMAYPQASFQVLPNGDWCIYFLRSLRDTCGGRTDRASTIQRSLPARIHAPIDAQKIRGKRIRLVISPSNQRIEGAAIPIINSHYAYRDIESGEELASFDVYTAKGGFMARWTQFPEGGHPWTIEGSTCVPASEGTLNKQYGFTVVN